MSLSRGLAVMVLACASIAPAIAKSSVDIGAMFDQAEREGRTGAARKTKPVDGRPAVPGEVIVTVIAGEGQETKSPPAQIGDMVVRNRCAATGNEEILVGKAKFAERYDAAGEAGDAETWRTYRPRGVEMRYFVVRDADGAFSFEAPWGEPMVARPGDVIVRNSQDARDVYRIAAAAFVCTYEVVRAAPDPR